MKLTRLVQEWFLEELEHVPARDPRRTSECLSFEQIEVAAQVPEATPAPQLAHIVGCDWCRRNWITFQRLEHTSPEPAPHEVTPLREVMPRIESHLETLASEIWTPEYTVMVSQYLHTASYLARENRELTPAHFDSEGTLRVHWSGLEQDGPVSISLLVHGRPQFLTSGIVNRGDLQIVQPLAHLGQRNVELPFSILQLQPVEAKGA